MAMDIPAFIGDFPIKPPFVGDFQSIPIEQQVPEPACQPINGKITFTCYGRTPQKN
jgi:hypothetical protein